MDKKKPVAMIESYARIVKHGGSYRVSLGNSLRKALTLNIGDYVHLYVDGEIIVLEKVTPNFTERVLK